jgi:hypothetical protein
MAKREKPTVDFSQLAGINSAADFYGWKAHIVAEIAKSDEAYANTLARTNSLMDFFMLKQEILGKVVSKNGGDGND